MQHTPARPAVTHVEGKQQWGHLVAVAGVRDAVWLPYVRVVDHPGHLHRGGSEERVSQTAGRCWALVQCSCLWLVTQLWRAAGPPVAQHWLPQARPRHVEHVAHTGAA